MPTHTKRLEFGPVARACLEVPTSVADLVGRSLGRYDIFGTLGVGGMGCVYEARDRELERIVALKVTRTGAHRAAECRLALEARTLGTLSHPNVVSVYDAGHIGHRFFIAMELVEGQRLDKWWAEVPDPKSRLAALLQAGEGLAAGHDAGVIHLDFKPANVMVGWDGRTRVVDFGLARCFRRAGTDPWTWNLAQETDPSGRLTRSGFVLGTPVYMAPEQLRGQHVGAAADQFAFCLVLYEAFANRRPFAASVRPGIAVVDGVAPYPLAKHEVPAHIRAAIARGLQPRPADRWPSMRALLTALRARRTRRRRVWGVGLIAVGLGGAATHANVSAEPCLPRESDQPALARAARSFGIASRSPTVTHWERTAAALEEHAVAWIHARSAACEAASRDAATFDRRARCLERSWSRRLDLLNRLAEGGAETASAAAWAVGRLPGPEGCLRASDGKGEPPTTPAIDRVRTLIDLGRPKAAVAAADRVVAEVLESARGPALLARGDALVAHGDLGAAGDAYVDAFAVARAHHDDPTAVSAATVLASLKLAGGEGPIAARWWLRHARASLPDDASPQLTAEVELAYARLHAREGARRRAGELAFAAVRRLEDAFGPDDRHLAPALRLAAGVALGTRDFERARAYYRRSLRMRSRVVGADHPEVAADRVGLGNASMHLRAFDDAERHYQRAYRDLEKAYGRAHPRVLEVALAFSVLARARGHVEEARRWAGHVLGESVAGKTRAKALLALGEADSESDPARAAPTLERALVAVNREFGSTHPRAETVLSNLGAAYLRLGQFDEAERSFRRAQQIPRVGASPDRSAALQQALAGLEGQRRQAEGDEP